MKRKVLSGTLILFFLLLTIIEVGAAKRVALVIGNGGYRSVPLDNPVNDANDITVVLKRLGFKVITKKNADQKTMEDSLREFKKKLYGAELGLFYYAGHGMQIKGVNYLIPVKHKIRVESDVKYFAVNANFVLSKMEDAGAPLNIVILDACRNNPLKRSFRDSSKGLAYMDAPDGTLIAYATKAGSVSEDGSGRNGTYTEALLRHIETPGLEIRMMFNQAGLDVEAKTGKTQKPWISNDSFAPYYLAGGASTIVSQSAGSTATRLKIDSEPPGADIFIHGRFKGRAPLEIVDIAPGSYSLEARLSGYLTEEKSIIVNQGRKAVVTYYLNRKAVKARLYVTTNPSDCRVRILNIKEKFYNGIELEKGRYKIEVSKQGYETKTQKVDILSSQGLDLFVELEDAEVYNNRGKAYKQQGDYAHAIKSFNKAIELNPSNWEAYKERGATYLMAGNNLQGFRDSNKALSLKPDYAEAFNNRGLAYARQGKNNKAIQDYTKAIKLKSDLHQAYINRGLAYNQQGNYNKAIQDYTKVIELKPDYAEAYFNRGNINYTGKNYNQAIQDYAKAIELKPDYAEAYAMRGTANFFLKISDKAISDYTKVKEIIQDLTKAIELEPDDAEVYAVRGSVYGFKGDSSQAISDLNKSIELKSDYGLAYRTRGAVYEGKGNYDQAIKDLTKAIELEPDDGLAYKFRGTVYEKQRKYKKANADFQKAKVLKK